MTPSLAVAAAGVCCWLGMVVAISFIEAPLKFRAPGITLQLGLGIGRLVFRALNTAEAVLAAVVLAALAAGAPPAGAWAAVLVAVGTLVAQVVAVRPVLHRRSDAVLAAAPGAPGPARRSRAHYAYVALEVVKVVALVVAAVLLFG
ncbi:hypothetical protein [uncultured Mycolicibacterium sp.]|uniref:hypothetical protein n=1 Tax=uncultured Mycolicibacterium sp. TaxID=2320817 RepID=UPI0026101E2E|nr:hypothetical protein [uncultured Mycolicibacterium sp.]